MVFDVIVMRLFNRVCRDYDTAAQLMFQPLTPYYPLFVIIIIITTIIIIIAVVVVRLSTILPSVVMVSGFQVRVHRMHNNDDTKSSATTCCSIATCVDFK